MKLPTLLATCLLGLSAPLHSAVVTHWMQDPPVTDIFQSTVPTTPSSGGYAWNSTDQGIAQTFRITSAHELEAFIFRAGAFTANNRPFSLKLYRTDALADNPVAVGTLLHTETGTLPANTTGAPDSPRFLALTLETPLVLAPDYYYTVVLQLTGGSGILGFPWGTEGYGDAMLWTSSDAGTTWSSNLNVFHLYLQGTSVVPEPGTTALLLGVGLVFLPFLRRQLLG